MDRDDVERIEGWGAADEVIAADAATRDEGLELDDGRRWFGNELCCRCKLYTWCFAHSLCPMELNDFL